MEKETFFIVPTNQLSAQHAVTADLYLDENFLFWPSFTLLDKAQIQQLSKYNIKRLLAKDQPAFLDENKLALQIEVHSQNQSEATLFDRAENRVFWRSYHTYFSFIDKTVQDFKKTGVIRPQTLSQPYTTFGWKLKETNLGPYILKDVREVAFNDPSAFHIHIILALTILTTLQGTALGLEPNDLKDLASASLLCTLGLFLLPLNQKKIFSPDGFLAHSFTGDQRKIYETYPLLSNKIAVKNQFNDAICSTVLTHRELINQKGFPNRVPSFKISQSSQILGLSYQLSQIFFSSLEKHSLYQSFVSLYQNWGEGYQKNLLKTLLDLIIPFKPQNIVQLQDGKVARVVKVNNEDAQYPLLSLNWKSENPAEESLFLAGETPETKILKVLGPSEIRLLL